MVNPIPLSTPLVAGLLSVTTAAQLSKVFGTYHLEVFEAQIKQSPYKSKALLRKIDQAINMVLDRKSRKGVRTC